MNKIKVEELACFDQVSKVIGVANAKRELFIAIDGYNFDLYSVDKGAHLKGAFAWKGTPQDSKYWRKINDGINPYNQ